MEINMDYSNNTSKNRKVLFTQSAEQVETYDFIEININIVEPEIENPFTDVRVFGLMEDEYGSKTNVEGFCDSQDGSVFKVRFMPSKPGSYKYAITFSASTGGQLEYNGEFKAVDGQRRGLLKVDPENPWHFIWEGTGEHYFLNGTTCYYLMGFEDEREIHAIIDRLHSLKINRLRVLLYGRQWDNPWGTPVVKTDKYNMTLNPWLAKNPEDVTLPEFDLKRFNVSYWQKYERMLAYARERDMAVSVIFFIGGQPLPTPFMEGSEDENRYYRYAAARFAAYSNVTWDIGNEHDFHRSYPMWGNMTGTLVRSCDPYKHLLSAHNKVYLQTWGNWNDMQLIQIWDAGLNSYLLHQKEEQRKSGRVIPQIIEEYGYEDLWESFQGHRSADTRRRCAWEVYMAGGYQTNGESPRTGTGVNEDTGGGWVNGRGDDSMVMLKSYIHMVDFFTSFDWWKTEPGNDVIFEYTGADCEGLNYYYQNGQQVKQPKALCLADAGCTYVFYLPAGGEIKVSLAEGKYTAERLNPRTGERISLPEINGSVWASPEVPDKEDWVFLLRK